MRQHHPHSVSDSFGLPGHRRHVATLLSALALWLTCGAASGVESGRLPRAQDTLQQGDVDSALRLHEADFRENAR